MYKYFFIKLFVIFERRTKWKRQNQLRLDQLRQQSVEPADPTAEFAGHKQHRLQPEPHLSGGRQEHRVYVPTDTDMAAEVSGAPSPSAAAAAAAFIGTPYQAANGARWNFLTTAAAIVRNVSYVHGCHI